jgi:KDO2-lipid IV(A) lauroyltransferase
MFKLLTLLSKLPLALLYALAVPLYVIGYYLVGYRKTVVYSNLQRAFPECTEQEIARLAKQFYKHFTDVIVEVVKAISIGECELLQRVHFRNPELIESYARQQQSILLLASHQCNWIWMLLAGSPAAVANRRAIQTAAPQRLRPFMLTIRSRFGSYPLFDTLSLTS